MKSCPRCGRKGAVFVASEDRRARDVRTKAIERTTAAVSAATAAADGQTDIAREEDMASRKMRRTAKADPGFMCVRWDGGSVDIVLWQDLVGPAFGCGRC